MARHLGGRRGDPALRALLAAVDDAYREADADRALLERSLELTSREMLERYEKLDQLHRRLVQQEKFSAMGRLAAGLAHELNNPLTVILGYAQTLAGKVTPDDAWSPPILSIEREARRCRALVQALLAFARPPKDAAEPVDLNAAAEAAMSLASPRARLSRVSISGRRSARLPPVLGHFNQLQQAVLNLVHNAIDAAGEGGAVRVSTKAADSDGRRWAVVQVEDDGPGIPPDVLPRLFEPFFSTKPAGRGTGLGLALVREIAERHEGAAEVDSRPGRTRFRLRLPVRGRKKR